ncbi:MAG: hypothetical protein IPN92_07940 [Chromatiaceae bacterium]|nr:hypothetical protein [Chromatiaceae bacterium]
MAGVLIDAGPLIALAGVEALGLLRNLFYEVQIPRAVFEECSAKAGLDRALLTGREREVPRLLAQQWVDYEPSHPVSHGAEM